MKVVSNASPLVNLGRIGRLDLLREIYGELLIADAVWQEVVVDGAGSQDRLMSKKLTGLESYRLPIGHSYSLCARTWMLEKRKQLHWH